MDTAEALVTNSELKLPEGLHERHPFNVADSSPELNDADFRLLAIISHGDLGNILHPVLDGIRDVWNNFQQKLRIKKPSKLNLKYIFTLHCFPEVITSPLLVNDLLVDLSRCDVVVPVQRDIQESLVVAQVQVHLPAIIEHEDFPMLVGWEGACINVYVGVYLDRSYMEPTVLENGANRAGNHPFSNATDDTSSDQNVFHSSTTFLFCKILK